MEERKSHEATRLELCAALSFFVEAINNTGLKTSISEEETDEVLVIVREELDALGETDEEFAEGVDELIGSLVERILGEGGSAE
jgi:hypothetical protein